MDVAGEALYDAQLDAFAREDAACRRLQTIPGVGPKVASALVAAAGDAKTFGQLCASSPPGWG